MNRLFQAWLETAYHRAVHSETGEAPAARWEKATPQERAVPEPALLREAFLWSERRKADKTALVRLHGNVYQVDAWLAGRMVELLFSPFDLDRIEVRLAGKPAGTAVPFVIGRHRHPKTRTPTGSPHRAAHRDRLPAALGDGHDAPCASRFLPVPRQRPREAGTEGEHRGAPGTALARTAAGAVRSLNHATLGGGPRQPADAYEPSASCRSPAGCPAPGPGRPWLAAALAAGRLGCDDGTDPPARSAAPAVPLRRPRTAAALARDLGRPSSSSPPSTASQEEGTR